MPDTPQTMSPRTITALIMGTLILWASYIAAGWYDRNPWRGVIVMACMGGFLGFWLLLLWNLKRKKRAASRRPTKSVCHRAKGIDLPPSTQRTQRS